MLSPYQSNTVSKISRKLQFREVLNEREIEKGVEVIDTLIAKGLVFNNISALSKLDNDEVIDASALYNRISVLKDEDWSKEISLGEQTQTLSFNEISVIRSVISKLKHKENIDFKRLGIVEDSLKKLKKFGINY